MSGYTVECIEPRSRPLRRTLQLGSGKEFAIYLLQGEFAGGGGLRNTVLTRHDQNPPPQSRLLLWVQVHAEGMVVSDVGRGLDIELLRADARSLVVAGMRIGRTAQFEVRPPGQARVSLTVAMGQGVGQGASLGVSGGKKAPAKVQYSADNVWWPITDSKGILVTIGVRAMDAFRDRLRKMGVDGRVFSFASGLIMASLTMGYLAWSQAQSRAAAETRAEEAEQAVELAQASRDASLASELVCIADRHELAAQLGEQREVIRLAATAGLQLSASQSLAIERGGRGLRSAELLPIDVAAQAALVAHVIEAIPGDPPEMETCLLQNASLGVDVPLYLLAWHPDPSLACTAGYRAVHNGQNSVGRWGLSDRLVRAYGDRGDAALGVVDFGASELVSDPREETRWSAYTATSAYRDILEALLRDQQNGRAAVLPSQLQLWGLVFLDAYNQMASPAGGAADRPIGECVTELIAREAGGADPAAPGQPILPDVMEVLRGDRVLEASPTAGCPWEEGAMERSAGTAMASVARIAAYHRDGRVPEGK